MDIRRIQIDSDYDQETEEVFLTINSRTHSGGNPELDEIISILETALQRFYSYRNKKKLNTRLP